MPKACSNYFAIVFIFPEYPLINTHNHIRVLGLDGFHMFYKSLPVEGGSGMGIGKDSDPEISHF